MGERSTVRLCVFEDEKYEELFPLSMTRATFELKCGYTTLLEKILNRFRGVDVSYFLRDYLAPIFKRRVKGEVINNLNVLKRDDFLLVNGRWLLNERDKLTLEGDEEVGLYGQDIAFARVRQNTIKRCLAENFTKFLNNIKDKVEAKEVEANLISYPWNLVNNNSKAIEEDFKVFEKRGVFGKFSPQAIIEGKEENVFIAETAEVQPFAVLDATCGPIILDEGVEVSPFSRIEGPTSVGRDTQILRSNIREGTSIGPVCRVGGEVEESIIHGYSNKYHTGFLGHAYVGEWVNLGALTTNSDLKNDYSAVEVHIKGKLTDSRETKVGCFIGDHTKTSVGCLLNTGAVVGVMSNVIASGEPSPKFIPSFCWYFRGRFSKGWGLRRMIETERVAMNRRSVSLTEEEATLFQTLYEMTKEEREKLIKRSKAKLRGKGE